MTDAARSSDHEILRMLAEAAGTTATPTAPDAPGVEEYDWHRPYRYTAEQIERLRSAGAELGRVLAGVLKGALGEPPTLELRDWTEQYGSSLQESLPPGMHVGLASPEGPAGMVTVRQETASTWVQRLLGGGAVAAEGEMSALETELLADLVRTLARACCEHLEAAGAAHVEPSGELVREPDGLVEPADVYCGFAFGDPEAQECDLVVTVAASHADALLGEAAPGEGSEAAAEDPATDPGTRIEAHLRSVPLRAAVRLATVEASMRDVAALEPGDVVVLQSVAQPAFLSVQGRDVLAGEVVSTGGRRGFRVLGPVKHP